MARVIEGINGAFCGKVGTVVGYTRNGVGIMRSLPKKTAKPQVRNNSTIGKR